MPGISVQMGTYGDRAPQLPQERYNSEESLEDNQSTSSSTEGRQSEFQKKDHEFIPTRSSGILASKPAYNPGQFTRVNSNPLLISAQKQMLQAEETKKKKKIEVKVGDDVPDWQCNLDNWKSRRRKQSEEALSRVSEIRRAEGLELDNDAGSRKRSIGRKISYLVENDDVIDLGDLPSAVEEDQVGEVLEERPPPVSEEEDPKPPTTPPVKQEPSQASQISTPVKGLPSTQRISPAAALDSSLQSSFDKQPVRFDVRNKESDPYESAIQGYKSLAISQFSEHDTSTSLSSATDKGEEGWKEKIDSYVQPGSRKSSAEISDKMRVKLANFQQQSRETAAPALPAAARQNIQADNSFKDKLKVFKSIETNVEVSVTSRRDSEPSLRLQSRTAAESESSLRLQSRTAAESRNTRTHSSSSALTNTMLNNKFFQQNSLSSCEGDDQLLDDALEESFSKLEEKDKSVFSAEDFIPSTERLAPPSEKPPPLPSNPPPLPPSQGSAAALLAKQEEEIIQTLEREEQDNIQRQGVSGDECIEESRAVYHHSRSSSIQEDPATNHHSRQINTNKNEAEKQGKRKDENMKDYNKHWLVQEAEQRRLAEAKSKQSQKVVKQAVLPTVQQGVPAPPQQGVRQQPPVPQAPAQQLQSPQLPSFRPSTGSAPARTHSSNKQPVPPQLSKQQQLLNENIYANVDPTAPTLQNDNSSGGVGLGGPEIPPRTGGEAQDRVLSVSGKKKCSACKEELGRGAAMIIESLRLFYHIRCFKCCVCSVQLGNGEHGTDVRVRNNRLHCQNCYSNDEGLKFSKV